MLDRRTFTFATLVAAAGPAAASAPNPAPAAPAGALDGSWRLKRRKDQVVATLTLHNRGAEPVDVQTQWGHQPGAAVQAVAGGEELPRILSDVERRDMMTRVGPRPLFQPVLAGASLELLPYVFQLADPDTVEVALTATVETDRGSVTLARQVLAIDGAGPAA